MNSSPHTNQDEFSSRSANDANTRRANLPRRQNASGERNSAQARLNASGRSTARNEQSASRQPATNGHREPSRQPIADGSQSASRHPRSNARTTETARRNSSPVRNANARDAAARSRNAHNVSAYQDERRSRGTTTANASAHHNPTGNRSEQSHRNTVPRQGEQRPRGTTTANASARQNATSNASARRNAADIRGEQRHHSAAPRQSQKRNRPTLALVLVAVILLGAIGLGSSCVASCTQSSGTSSQPSNPLAFLLPGSDHSADQQPNGRFSNKLDGSTEVVDENGIVHGTTPSGINYTVHGRDSAAYQEGKVTLAAVGDQVVSDNALYLARANAGDSGYNFSPFYQEIGPYLRQYDLRYINQETTCATSRGFSVRGYPIFNSPDSAIEAIAAEQFNLVNFNSNHAWDCGIDGIEATHEVFDRYPEIMVGGSYLTQQDRETVHMIERNGITFAFLSYCYGYNGYQPDNDYYTCGFDEDLITADVQRAHEVADAVIVAMHWGDEYITRVSDFQAYWAGFLADLDVDLVLGSHAHIMQPVEYVTGPSGNTIPVVYGLSDIVSGWTLTDTILSGIVTCDFVPQENGELALENLTWHPTIEWSDGGTVWVRMLENMSDEEIAANTRTEDVADDVPYLHDIINSCIQQVPTTW